MNLDINVLKHYQLVEDGQLEGCYIHQPTQGSLPGDKAVLAERRALEKMGYKVVQGQVKSRTTMFAEAMQKFSKKSDYQPK